MSDDNNKETTSNKDDSSPEPGHENTVSNQEDESVESFLTALREKYNIPQNSPNSLEVPENRKKNKPITVAEARVKEQRYLDSLKRSHSPENKWDINLGGAHEKNDKNLSSSKKMDTIKEEDEEDILLLYKSWESVKKRETTGSSELDKTSRDSATDSLSPQNHCLHCDSNRSGRRRRSPEPTRFRPELVTLEDILDLDKPQAQVGEATRNDSIPANFQPPQPEMSPTNYMFENHGQPMSPEMSDDSFENGMPYPLYNSDFSPNWMRGSYDSNLPGAFHEYADWYPAAFPPVSTLFHYPPQNPITENQQDEDQGQEQEQGQEHENIMETIPELADHDYFGSPAKRARRM